MASLSVLGSLLGLVPPIALGILVNALVERNDKAEAAVLSLVIVAAIVLEAASYIASDFLYARNAAQLYRDLRVRMFVGAREQRGVEDPSALASRFISDAESVDRVTVGALDTGAMLSVELVAATIALGLLQPLAVAAVAALAALTTVVVRWMQAPTVPAGQRRQEELQRMSETLTRELSPTSEPRGALRRFREAAERLRRVEVRLGWLSAINLQGSGALAAIGPIAAVTLAAFAGTHRAGTLLSLYLLSGRVLNSFDGLVDLRLSMQMVRGAIRRCFALIEPSDTARLPSAVAQ